LQREAPVRSRERGATGLESLRVFLCIGGPRRDRVRIRDSIPGNLDARLSRDSRTPSRMQGFVPRNG
jgi:hypothetical protein